MAQVHATAVSIEGNGVLLMGDSCSGKSDLALRLLQQDARLVTDDRAELFVTEGHLNVSPPPQLEGMLEIRGVGIVVLPFDKSAPVAMVCELTPRQEIERLPEAKTRLIEGVRLPVFRIDPFELSAPEKVRMALRLVTGIVGSVA